MTGEAPRGCIGYHVSFDVATKIITHFLPAVGGDTQATEERKTAHDQATNIEDAENSVFSLKFSSINTEVVHGISLLTYIVCIFYLKAHFSDRATQSSLEGNKVKGTLSLILNSGNSEYGVMSEQVSFFSFIYFSFAAKNAKKKKKKVNGKIKISRPVLFFFCYFFVILFFWLLSWPPSSLDRAPFLAPPCWTFQSWDIWLVSHRATPWPTCF